MTDSLISYHHLPSSHELEQYQIHLDELYEKTVERHFPYHHLGSQVNLANLYSESAVNEITYKYTDFTNTISQIFISKYSVNII